MFSLEELHYLQFCTLLNKKLAVNRKKKRFEKRQSSFSVQMTYLNTSSKAYSKQWRIMLWLAMGRTSEVIKDHVTTAVLQHFISLRMCTPRAHFPCLIRNGYRLIVCDVIINVMQIRSHRSKLLQCDRKWYFLLLCKNFLSFRSKVLRYFSFRSLKIFQYIVM